MHAKATPRETEVIIQLLICQMAKGNQGFRASLVEINPETKQIEKEVSFFRAKTVEELEESIVQKGGIDLTKAAVVNGKRCKKSKSSKKLTSTNQECGKIKKFALSNLVDKISKRSEVFA